MFITLTKVYSNEVRLFCELCLSGNKKTVQCTVFFSFSKFDIYQSAGGASLPSEAGASVEPLETVSL